MPRLVPGDFNLTLLEPLLWPHFLCSRVRPRGRQVSGAVRDLLLRVKPRAARLTHIPQAFWEKWRPRKPCNWLEAHRATFAQELPLAVVQQAGRQQ